MKTNISLELDDNQRGCLADWLDGKTSKRLATRREIVNFVDALVMGIIDSHAAGYPADVQPADSQPENVQAFEDCMECGGLGCDYCDDGVIVVHSQVKTQQPTGPADWESHPRLARYATEIDAGLAAHGFAGTYQERSYRRGWTLESIGSNR